MRRIDTADSRDRVELQVRDWNRATTTKSRARLSRAAAARAIEAIPPQMAIDALLSREWQNRGATRYVARQEQVADLVLDRRSTGPELSAGFAAELCNGDWFRRRALFLYRSSEADSQAGLRALEEELAKLPTQDVDLVDLDEGPPSRYELTLLGEGLPAEGTRALLTDEARAADGVGDKRPGVLLWLARHPEGLRTPLLLANGRTATWDPEQPWRNLVPMLELLLPHRG